MTNGSDNIYDRLSRCLRIVERHNGSSIDVIYAKTANKVKETKHYKIKDYYQKILNDGHIYVTEDNRIKLTPQEDL